MRTRSWLAVTPVVVAVLVAGCADGVAPVAGGQVITAANAARLQRIVSLPVPDSVIGFLAFSPDNRTLIAKGRTGEVLAWETGTWSRSTLQPAFMTQAEAYAAQVPFYPTMALSPDGRNMATVTSATGDVSVRQVRGSQLSTFSYGSPVYSVAISPDGALVAVGGLNGNVVVREAATGRQVADLTCDRQYVSALVFSPDGGTLVAAYERPGNLMKAWSTSTWLETATFSQMTERVDYHDAVFTPDGRYLVVARVGTAEPNVIEMLDMSTFQVVRRISGQVSAFQLALSPDGTVLASGWADVRLWGTATGNLARAIGVGGTEVFSVAFSPDGTLLAFSVFGGDVQVWSVPR